MREHDEMMQAIDLLQLSESARSTLLRKIMDYHNSTTCTSCQYRWSHEEMLNIKIDKLKKAVTQLREQLMRVRLCDGCGRCSSCITLEGTKGLV